MNNIKDYSYHCRLRIEYMHGIDIKENYLLGLGNGILDKSLLDRTTGENIIRATDDYASMANAYTFFQHITPEETLKDNPELYDILKKNL